MKPLVSGPPSSTEHAARPQASVLLDLVRGLAALLVLLAHWRNFLFVDYEQLSPSARHWMLPIYGVTSTGHAAVIIFFVLSGYLVSGSVFRLFARNAWSWKTYLTHRLVRLWVVLLPGLALCALCDSIGVRSHWAPLLYSGRGSNHMTPNVAEFLTPRLFFSNLLFLQTILTPIFGSDGALWSLAFEFWYYILFALGISAIRGRRLIPRVFFAIGCLAVAYFVRGAILHDFPIWLAGTALAMVPPPRLPAWTLPVATLFYAVIFFCVFRVPLPALAGDYLLTIFTVAFLWVLLSARKSVNPNSLGTRTSAQLAGFSYTLYVVHMPFLLLLTAAFAGDVRWQGTPQNVIRAIGILLVTLAYSYTIAWFTEFRTSSVRRWIERRLSRA
jgi:peptidoglycan/LPS O-acetylase OafA/YrhL